MAWLDQSTSLQSVKIRPLISLMQGLKRGHGMKKGKKCLNKAKDSWPGLERRDSMSDLFVFSIRDALSHDPLYLYLTGKCGCFCSHCVLSILKGWQMSYSSETGVNTPGLAVFYLLCLSERLQLLWFDESLSRLQQRIMLFYCHLVVSQLQSFIPQISPLKINSLR